MAPSTEHNKNLGPGPRQEPHSMKGWGPLLLSAPAKK